jgi:transcriptional regulator with XRE-family HTH domain
MDPTLARIERDVQARIDESSRWMDEAVLLTQAEAFQTFGGRLYVLRERERLSIPALSGRSGVAEHRIRDLELRSRGVDESGRPVYCDRQRPTPREIAGLVKALRVDEAYLMAPLRSDVAALRAELAAKDETIADLEAQLRRLQQRLDVAGSGA